jgi:glycosyltransferase involved in cell wall biosynthesis
MKHVLALVPSLRMGGAEIQALRNCEALLGAGYEVTLATIFRADGDFFAPELAALQARGLRHVALLDRPVAKGPQGPKHFLGVLVAATARLRGLYETLRPDVVYTRLWYASLLALLTNRVSRYRPELVFNEESRLRPAAAGLKERIRLAMLKRAGCWVVPCQGLFDEAVALGSPAERGLVMPNIVPGTGPLGGAPTGPLSLGFLGRLEPAKGLERMLELASRLDARGVDFRLTMAGSGTLESWLRAEIDRRGLGARVRMLGAVSDLAGFFRGVDLLLLTSHYEGFANVIVEANSYGVPALAMKVPHGPADVIQEGVNGFLVPDGDVDAMVALLAGDVRSRLAEMRAGCWSLAEETYSVRAQQARWQALLEATR